MSVNQSGMLCGCDDYNFRRVACCAHLEAVSSLMGDVVVNGITVREHRKRLPGITHPSVETTGVVTNSARPVSEAEIMERSSYTSGIVVHQRPH